MNFEEIYVKTKTFLACGSNVNVPNYIYDYL